MRVGLDKISAIMEQNPNQFFKTEEPDNHRKPNGIRNMRNIN